MQSIRSFRENQDATCDPIRTASREAIIRSKTIRMTYSQPRSILTSTNDTPPDDAIAIVGAACQYPAECCDQELFWQFLRDGRSAVVEAPPERLTTTFRGAEAGKAGSRCGGFLPHPFPAGFDAAFFDIPPAEAQALDPQQR